MSGINDNKRKEYQRAWYKANKEKHLAYGKAWAKQNKDKIRIASKLWRDRNPTKMKAKHLKAKYDLTLEEFNALKVNQKGVCKICNNPESDKSRDLAVDHDWITGKIRGLLCRNCNVGIGNLKHSVEYLKSAIEYLRK